MIYMRVSSEPAAPDPQPAGQEGGMKGMEGRPKESVSGALMGHAAEAWDRWADADPVLAPEDSGVRGIAS